MAWSFVKQPNGRLARFSEIVDNFTHLNATLEEAFNICTLEHGMNNKDAFDKIQRGLDDEPYSTTSDQTRWNACLADILRVHGNEAVNKVIELIGKPSDSTIIH